MARISCYTMQRKRIIRYWSRRYYISFLVQYAISSWLSGKNGEFICSSAAGIIIFRSELMIYMGLLLLIKLIRSDIGLLELLVYCAVAGPSFLGK